MAEKFTFFWSGVFSQWHPSTFVIDGVTYNCTEQYMMAEKARLFGDTGTEAMIMATADPAMQKRFGRQVSNFDESVWNATARDIVLKANIAKFSQNPGMEAYLMATVGTTLVEASPEDTIWGIGLRKTDPRAYNRATWRGTNWLGEVLNITRDLLTKA